MPALLPLPSSPKEKEKHTPASHPLIKGLELHVLDTGIMISCLLYLLQLVRRSSLYVIYAFVEYVVDECFWTR